MGGKLKLFQPSFQHLGIRHVPQSLLQHFFRFILAPSLSQRIAQDGVGGRPIRLRFDCFTQILNSLGVPSDAYQQTTYFPYTFERTFLAVPVFRLTIRRTRLIFSKLEHFTMIESTGENHLYPKEYVTPPLYHPSPRHRR